MSQTTAIKEIKMETYAELKEANNAKLKIVLSLIKRADNLISVVAIEEGNDSLFEVNQKLNDVYASIKFEKDSREV